MIHFDAELFRICLPFAAGSDDRRAYLRGVYVEPRPDGGVILVATDGHRMIVVHDERGQADAPVIVTWTGATKPLRSTRGAERRTIRIDDGALTVESRDVRYSGTSGRSALTDPTTVHVDRFEPIDATYPDWRRIVPLGPFTSNGSVTLDGLYLADFGRAGADLSLTRIDRRRPDGAMVIRHDGKGGPALIRWPDVDFAFGMLMPRRDTILTSDIPAFVSRPAARTEDAA